MATTYQTFIDGTALPNQPVKMGLPMEVHKITVNFSTQALDAGEADIHQVFQIPAGYFVMHAWAKVVTAAPANATCDLGYGGSVSTVNYWGNALALDSTANTVLGTTYPMRPVYFATADTVDVLATTDTADVNLSSGVIDVYIAIMKA